MNLKLQLRINGKGKAKMLGANNQSGHTAKAKILVVDDDLITAAGIQNSLNSFGYQVIGVARNSEEAINAVKTERPDLVLMDINLRGSIDGIETSQKIQEIVDVPIIFVTAYSDESTLQRAKLIAPYGYLIKPFDNREMYMAIELALYKSSMENRLKASEEKYRSIFENIQDVYFETSLEGIISEVSPSIVLLTKGQYKREDLIGKSIYNFYVNEKERQTLLADLKTNGNVSNFEIILRNRDGSAANCMLAAKIGFNNFGKPEKIIGSMHDITEQKHSEKMMIEAKEIAERSDKLKTEFLAQMSHEIRSPMNAVLSFANLLKTDLGENIKKEYLEYIDGIDLAGRRLMRTVEMILNASELQVGTYEPAFLNFDLMKEVIEKIKIDYTRLALGKGIKLNVSSSLPKAVVYADQYSVYQLFVNLVDNAIKYSIEGFIDIRVDYDEINEVIKVLVEDSGIGMSEEFMTRMFLPFTQEDVGYSRRFEGNGLGLSLVKKYCDMNGITISVESKKGEGTTFILSFPKKKDDVKNHKN